MRSGQRCDPVKVVTEATHGLIAGAAGQGAFARTFAILSKLLCEHKQLVAAPVPAAFAFVVHERVWQLSGTCRRVQMRSLIVWVHLCQPRQMPTLLPAKVKLKLKDVCVWQVADLQKQNEILGSGLIV